MPTQAEYDRILTKLILAEGAEYTNHPADKGGPTKYGITLKTLRGLPNFVEADADTVRRLTLDAAKMIYTSLYARPFMFIADPLVFQFVFNAAVQHGVKTAAKILQKAVGFTGTDVDGVIGEQTMNAVNVALINRTELLAKLVAKRCNFYADILSENPGQRVFAAGWLNRIAKDLV